MKWARLKEVYGERFRSFVEPFRIELPEAGLTLAKGLNRDTGDSSASGKSSLVLAIAHLFGGCPFPGTELTSWGAEETYLIGAVVSTPDGDYRVERSKGLSVRLPNGETIKGKAAEAELDKLFGLDAKLRALTTYRGQGQDGLFLGMSDPEKKEFLTRVLGLDRYEKIAIQAAEKAKVLNERLLTAEGRVTYAEVHASQLRQLVTPPDVVDIDALNLQIEEMQASIAKTEKLMHQHLATAEEVRKRALKEAEEKTSSIRSRLSEVISRPPMEELVAAEAELVKVGSRLQKVKEHDAKRRLEEDAKTNELRLAIKDAQAIINQRPRLAAELKRLQHQQTHLRGNTCPTCKQTWVTTDAGAELKQVEAAIKKTSIEIETCDATELVLQPLKTQLAAIPAFEPHPYVAQLSEKEQELKTAVAAYQKQDRDLRKSDSDSLQKEERRIKTEIATACELERDGHIAAANILGKEINRVVSECGELERKVVNAQLAAKNYLTYKKAFDDAETQLAAERAAKQEIQIALDAELDLAAMVGREGFLGVIFDDVLTEIAAATNNILGRVANVRHIVFDFESEKETQKGSIQRRITPVVTIDGRRVQMSSGCSGGMQSAVKLAVDLAVGEVVAKRRGSYPGWLILDESFDGLGRVSKKTCLEMLQSYAGDRLVLIIDHATEFQSSFQQVINIESIDGKSRIV